jgi:hypothetical protein
MTQADLMKMAIAAGIAFAAYKYLPNMAMKSAALGVLGVMVAKRIPYVGDAL